VAGGLEVEKIGVATVTRDEILRDLLRGDHTLRASAGNDKLMTLDGLKHELDSRRRLGQRVAFTNGCFDVLHAGHVQYLQEAAAFTAPRLAGVFPRRACWKRSAPPEATCGFALARKAARGWINLHEHRRLSAKLDRRRGDGHTGVARAPPPLPRRPHARHLP